MKLSISPEAPPEEGPAVVPLSALAFDPEVNARGPDAYDAEGLDQLEATLAADGVLLPLLVYRRGAGFAPADGGRRLAVLQRMAEKGAEIAAPFPQTVTPDFPVRVEIRPRPAGEGEEKAVSLAVKISAEPLHPVDRYEAFAALKKAGFTDEAVRARYGLKSVRAVERALALGALIPEIRAAWRAGDWKGEGEDEAAIAGAFALAGDEAQQAQVFARCRDEQNFNPHFIRRLIVPAGQEEARRLLKFVGREKYETMGGAVRDDLFSEPAFPIVEDVKKLKHCAALMLEAERRTLTGEGVWKNVHLDAEIAPDRRAAMTRIKVGDDARAGLETPEEKTARAGWTQTIAEAGRLREILDADDDPSAEEIAAVEAAEDAAAAAEDALDALDNDLRRRALEALPEEKRGCAVLRIDENGRLAAAFGLKFPALSKTPDARAAKPPVKKKTALAKKEKEALPRKALEYLGAALTAAAKKTLRADPAAAIALYVWVLETNNDNLQLDPDFKTGKLDREGRAAELLSLTFDELAPILGARIAASVDLAGFAIFRFREEDDRAFIEVLPREDFRAALAEALDLAEFFRLAGREAALAAIADCQGAEEAVSYQKMPAADVAAYALARAGEKNWLPPPLRFSFYDGPATAKGWPPPSGRAGKAGAPQDEGKAKKKPAKKKTAKTPLHPEERRTAARHEGHPEEASAAAEAVAKDEAPPAPPPGMKEIMAAKKEESAA